MAIDGEDAARIEALATVGELVLISNALDHALAEVLIAATHLAASPMLLPIIMTLDPSRKIEILKARAGHIDQADWQGGLNSFVKKAEKVFRFRNIAAHTQPVLEGGNWFLKPVAAAKFLKALDLENKTVDKMPVSDLRSAVKLAEEALGEAQNLQKNFARVEEARTRQKAINK